MDADGSIQKVKHISKNGKRVKPSDDSAENPFEDPGFTRSILEDGSISHETKKRLKREEARVKKKQKMRRDYKNKFGAEVAHGDPEEAMIEELLRNAR